MNPKYLLPRFTPLNIFENIFVFAQIFTKVVFFQSKFRVTIPRNCTISRYCYPEIYQFLSNNTLKLKMFGYCYPEIDPAFWPFGQFPGIFTQKLKIVQFLGIVTRKLTISEYLYSEIDQLPSNNTWQ